MTQKITEWVPEKKIAWHVTRSHLTFVRDENEWAGTDMVFELHKKGDMTELRFTHVGLVPSVECYDNCRKGWTFQIQDGLRKLIAKKSGPHFTTSFMVDQTPEQVFDAINDVRGWWSENIEGRTDVLGTFEFHYNDAHRSVHEITELVRGKKVAWHITDSRIDFVKDKSEWTETDIVFDIAKKGDKTELRFTHVGRVPAIECYDKCSSAWSVYVERLRHLITSKDRN